MGVHTSRITRSGDLTVAVNFAWAVGAGTGTNPVAATDFPGDVFPSGTGTIPANSTYIDVTFNSKVDAVVEPDETGIFTVTTTQSGVTIAGSPQTFTVTNDDVANSNIYGPTTTAKTPVIDGGTTGYTMTTTLYPGFELEVLSGDASDMQPGWLFKEVGGPASTRASGYSVDASGAQTITVGQYNNQAIPDTTNGVPCTINVLANGTFELLINGVRFGNFSAVLAGTAAANPYLRIRPGNGTQTASVTVTAK